MKVQDLLSHIKHVNPIADVQVVVNNYPVDFEILIGGAEGCTTKNCSTLSFMVGGTKETQANEATECDCGAGPHLKSCSLGRSA